MAWKHVDDDMPKERETVWAWYGWEERPVKAHWERDADGEVAWMHPQHYVIGVRYWMTLKEMAPKRMQGKKGWAMGRGRKGKGGVGFLAAAGMAAAARSAAKQQPAPLANAPQ